MKVINITDNKVLLVADEGKWLTNGIDYAKTISLADGVPQFGYYEISDEEYENLTGGEDE